MTLERPGLLLRWSVGAGEDSCGFAGLVVFSAPASDTNNLYRAEL